MSNHIIEVLKMCLEHFYPSFSHTVDDKYYPSKKEMYAEWLDSQYLNGSWYIGEEIEPVVACLERSIENVLYLIEGSNRYSLGFKLKYFTPSQKVTGKVVFDDDNQEYIFQGTLFEPNKQYTKIELGDEIRLDNIKSITVSTEEVIENHIKYTSVDIMTFNSFILVTGGEFDDVRRNNVILQKLDYNIQCMNYKVRDKEEYGIRLRNVLPSYYDSNQELIIRYNDRMERIPVDSSFSFEGLFERPMNNILLEITLTPYGEYTGFVANVIFNSVNGNRYTSSSNIEYLSQ